MDIPGEGFKESEHLVKHGEDKSCDKEETGTSKNQDKDDPEHQPLLSKNAGISDNVSPPGLSLSSKEKRKEMKIDIPSGDSPKHIHLPSLQKQHLLTHKQKDLLSPHLQKQQSAGGPLKMAVYLKRNKKPGDDDGCYILELEKGRATVAGEIKEMMLELLAIPKSSAHLFALWFISPHLELQLKYHHPPFYLRKQWCELLLRFTHCPQDEVCLDEPVVVFQRNSFITVDDERKDTEMNVVKLLFEEARYNILKARYPIPVADAEMLGAILLRCYEGEFSPENHKAGAFKKRLNEFLPYYAIGYNKISQYIYSSTAEQHVLQQYESISKNLNDNFSCYMAFLDYCRELPFYGCAFFKGYCFQEGVDFKIWKREQQEITVGLNRCGITLFKADNEEMLSYLRYNEFSWDCKVDEEITENSSPIEIFIIEYDDADNKGSRQIQIVSKQSCLMDAMVESCADFIGDVPPSPHNLDTSNRRKLHNISYKVVGSP